MKLRTQLLILVLLALAGLVSVAGLAQYQLDRVYTATNFANVNSMPAIIALDDTAGALTRVRVSLYRHLLSKDSAQMSAIEQKMAKARADMDKGLKAYEATLADERDRQLFQADNSAVSAYDALRENVLSLSRVNRTDEALALLSANQSVLDKVTEAFDEHRQYNVVLGQKGAEEAVTIKQTATWLSLAIAALVLAAIGITGWRTARKVMEQLGCEPSEAAEYARKVAAGDLAFHMNVQDKNPGSLIVAMHSMVGAIQALVGDAALLAKAGVEGRLSTRADAYKHQGEYRRIVQGVNDTLDGVIGPLNVAADYVHRIAKGDIPPKITAQYQGDFNAIKNNLNVAIDSINALVVDALALSKAAVEGKLATRADAAKHQGEYRRIVDGVNQTLDAVIGPLNVAADYVDRIAGGDIPPKIIEAYNGDFNVLKNNLNLAIDNINALVADALLLSKAAVDGKLATRADASKHQGDYLKIVDGVNQTLDAIVTPLNTAADYVERIAKGDIPPKITETYQGDFNTIKNNLNLAIDNVNALVADASALSKAAVEGKLATRAEASKHQGDYRKIVQGVNDTLDAVIGPLNVAANYVDHIAKGDIPPKITDSYNGDFNVIKSNLNTCIDAVNALVLDAELLNRAAVEGRLETRADAAKHQGDYRKIVEGVNETLDAIVAPVEEVVRVLGALAQGDLTEKIHDSGYQGTFAQLRDDANTTVDNLAASVLNIKEATDAINTAAKEIATGNADLSQRTEEQASSLEETASSMEQLASTVKQNADNARQANQMAVAASDVAIRGGDMVQRVVGTMSDINESSRKVVDIIGVIDGIAFQTNILALNAAVEAARAGEQGRGFAVVAGEVRNLAQRSAAAAKEIKALIGDSVDKAEGGAKLVAEAGKTMDEIVTSVKRVTDIMSEIAAASVEQSSGIEQVNQAITQMDDVTQQNAALVEEAAASAESLEDQAGILAQAVARFRLSQGSAFLAPPRTTQLAAHKPAPPTRPAAKKAPGKRVEARHPAPVASASLAALKKEGGEDDWAEF